MLELVQNVNSFTESTRAIAARVFQCLPSPGVPASYCLPTESAPP